MIDSRKPDISVVIPTRNRAETLDRALARLFDMCADKDCFEVVVVDDGSRDHTREVLHAWAANTRNLSFFVQDGLGPAAARNKGVAESRADIVLLLGDDVFPECDVAAMHMQAHEGAGAGLPKAVLGRVRTAPELLSDRFMQWLDASNMLFDYQGLDKGHKPRFWHFYTANISVPRELLLKERFDERFEHAAWEDVDLGYRLWKSGMRLHYASEIEVSHHHLYTVKSFLEARKVSGRSYAMLVDFHPELEHVVVPPVNPLIFLDKGDRSALVDRLDAALGSRDSITFDSAQEHWDMDVLLHDLADLCFYGGIIEYCSGSAGGDVSTALLDRLYSDESGLAAALGRRLRRRQGLTLRSVSRFAGLVLKRLLTFKSF